MAAAAAETAAARAEGARVALETELSTVKQREKEKARSAQNSLAVPWAGFGNGRASSALGSVVCRWDVNDMSIRRALLAGNSNAPLMHPPSAAVILYGSIQGHAHHDSKQTKQIWMASGDQHNV